MIMLADAPSRTYGLVPFSSQPPSASVARTVIPASVQLPYSSMIATVASVSPEAMPGRWRRQAASSPDCRRVFAASTTVENNGEQSRARPDSSRTIASSPNP